MLSLPAGLVGRDFDYGETFVSPEAIARYADMVGDAETLRALADGSDLAPPTFCLSLHRGMRPEVQLPPDVFGVYGGHDLEFARPVRAGRKYRISARVTGVFEKSGRSGPMAIVSREATIRGENDEVIVRLKERQIVRRRPANPDAIGPRRAVEPEPTANAAVSFATHKVAPGEIELGAEIGPLLRPATTAEQVAKYVVGGEMKEALFTDLDQARNLGYRGIVVPGPMLTAFLEHFLRATLPGWRLERLSTTFRIPTITGDPIHLSGVISEHHDTVHDSHIVCDLVAGNPSGENAVTASARLRNSEF